MTYRLTKVRLHNICQHDDLEADISTGLTAITGPNGSGKTSIIRGLVYALTGMVDGLWGNQQTLQKDGTADIGYAEAEFTDGASLYAVRRFSTSSVKFADAITKDGNIIVQRRQKVNEFMENVFGMPVILMFQVCWGRQGELAQLLKGTPATISTFLAQVFDTKQLEKIRDKIKVQLDTIANLSSICISSLERDKQSLAELPAEGSFDADIEHLQDMEKRLSDEMLKLVEPIKSGMLELDRKTRITEAKYKIEQYKAEIAACQVEDTDEPLDGPSLLAEQQSLMDARNPININIGNAELGIDAIKKNMADLQKRIEQVSDTIEKFNKEHAIFETDTCVFCGSHIENQQAYQDAVNEHVFKTKEGLVSEALGRELAALQESLRQYEDDFLPGTQKVLDDELQKRNEIDAELEIVRAKLEVANLRKLKTLLKAEQTKLETLEAMPDADQAAIAYGKLMAALEQTKRELQQKIEERASTEASRQLLLKAIEDDEAAVAQYELNKNARDALIELRDVFSQQRAQARYLKAQIQNLNKALSQQVRLTKMPFSLRLDEDSRTFVYTTSDGYDHPAVHLSGAQQAMSAVALQMALFAVMQPNMNLFLIDEPTEALDNENKIIMAEMFDRMNRMLPSVEGTMLIVTRDDPIIACCNGNIAL